MSTGEDSGRALEPNVSCYSVSGELGLHGLEQITVEDRLMLPKIQLAPIDDLADVEPVLDQIGEGHFDALSERAEMVATVAAALGPHPPADLPGPGLVGCVSVSAGSLREISLALPDALPPTTGKQLL